MNDLTSLLPAYSLSNDAYSIGYRQGDKNQLHLVLFTRLLPDFGVVDYLMDVCVASVPWWATLQSFSIAAHLQKTLSLGEMHLGKYPYSVPNGKQVQA